MSSVWVLVGRTTACCFGPADAVQLVGSVHCATINLSIIGGSEPLMSFRSPAPASLCRAFNRLKGVRACLGERAELLCPTCCRYSLLDRGMQCSRCSASMRSNFPGYMRVL